MAELLAGALGVYAVIGVLFAVAFVTAGVQRVDPVAEHAPLGFRLMILPGAAALWPMMLMRWLREVRR